nr:MAG TPA: hypothetical protein [Caudoviricetes sp.]
MICYTGLPEKFILAPFIPSHIPGFVNSVRYSDGLYPVLFYIASDIAVDQSLCITALLAVFTA